MKRAFGALRKEGGRRVSGSGSGFTGSTLETPWIDTIEEGASFAPQAGQFALCSRTSVEQLGQRMVPRGRGHSSE